MEETPLSRSESSPVLVNAFALALALLQRSTAPARRSARPTCYAVLERFPMDHLW